MNAHDNRCPSRKQVVQALMPFATPDTRNDRLRVYDHRVLTAA